ncbi:hypothetical protein ABKN59_005310 [Abortiporus biennis]
MALSANNFCRPRARQMPVSDCQVTPSTENDLHARFFFANFADAIMNSLHVSFGLRIRDAVDFFINNTSDCAGT